MVLARRLKYVNIYKDRHGKTRAQFRRRGTSHSFQSPVYTPEFFREYECYKRGEVYDKIDKMVPHIGTGTISELIVLFYQSPNFKDLGVATKKTYQGIMEKIRRYTGDLRVANFQRRHLQTMLGTMSSTPMAANDFLKKFHLLMVFAISLDMRNDDPTVSVQKYKNKSTGFHTWNEEEIKQFEDAHPSGTKARLAFSIMIYLGVRRGDAVKLGWQHIRQGRFHFKQNKTHGALSLPIVSALQKELDKTPRDNLTLITTENGRARPAKGLGQSMRTWCEEAGLPDRCRCHGLRKAAARRLAEAGCTPHEIMAITGHKSLNEVARYTEAVKQVTLSDTAVAKLTNPKQKVSQL